MSGNRIVIVALALLGVVFFVGVGLGLRSDQGPADLNAGWLTGMSNLLVGDHNVAAADISAAQPASCLQNETLVIAPGQQCSYTIAASNSSDRKMPLRLTQGTAATANLSGQPSALDVTQSITGADAATGLDVYKDGALLVVTCNDPATSCQLALQ